MKRPAASALLLSVALGLAATPASAQESTNPIEQPASATLAPSPTPSVRKRERAISSEVAASLAAAMPKYNPPKPAPPPKPVEEQPDLREVDKPKNTIIRLPNYVVREAKPPVFRERDINTKAGMANIAMKKYGTEASRALNRFTIPLFGQSQEDRALAQYAEDERLKTITELNDAADMVSARDKAQGVYIKRDIQNTTMRAADYGWQKKQ
jgi:hypothetical protein